MPKITSAYAPTRIDFVGGWTDVQPFCENEVGLVINAALGIYARVRVTETVHARPNPDPFIQAACKRFAIKDVAVELSSDAPIGSGLGGSGAVGVALVGALASYAGMDLPPREIAELAHRIEIEDLGIIGGKQDQYAAAFGGFLALGFQGTRVEVEQIILPAPRVLELQDRSVVVYTGQSRISGNIHAHVQEAFLQSNPSTLAALETIRRVARRFQIALQTGPLDDLGELLNENWDAQKRLHPSTTNEIVESFFAAALSVGALGGKALGAGGGGCLYFLARQGEQTRLQQALRAAGGKILQVQFDLNGCSRQ